MEFFLEKEQGGWFYSYRFFPQVEQNFTCGVISLPQFWQNCLRGVSGFCGGVAGAVGGVFVVLVLLLIETSVSWMLNITMIASQISLQPRLPRVSSASPPSIPPAPIE